MYGYFIHAFEKFITLKYGKERWDVIRVEAGVFEDKFDDYLTYDDNMIIEIMDGAREFLDIEPEELQKEFGEVYFEKCILSSKHGPLLRKLGGNLYDFIGNIDSLHDILGVSYPGLKLPSFRVKKEIGGRMSVNYYSDREELEYVVPGIIKSAAKILFDLDVQATIPISEFKTIIITTTNPDDSDRMFPKEIESARDLIPRANEPKVSPLEFTRVFPFHMIFDQNMILKQIGAALTRTLPDINIQKCPKITSYFTISRPQISFDFDSIYSRLNNLFILTVIQSVAHLHRNHHQTLARKHSNGTRRTNLRLKGQMVFMEDKGLMLFLCSPVVNNIQDMRNKGLCLDDIPIHDATRDLVLLCDNVQKEMELAQQLNIVSDHLKKIHSELEEHLYLYNRLLYAVLPTTIAQKLGDGKPVPTERFLSVTLMFSGIVDFSNICSKIQPGKIVSMLNELYTKFDGLVGYLQDFAYKVETVGDKYMTASGVPEKVSNHPDIICSLALDMHDVAKEVKFNGKEISVTFGIHSGEIVAGVIGHKMPRYCLFGNTVNLTSRTETTGVPGKVNVTEDTYRLLDHGNDRLSGFHFEKRGQVKMKGKSDPMTTYLLRRKNTKSIPNYPQASPGTSDYISIYRKMRHTGSHGSGRKGRRFGGSRPASIVNTPGLRSRCSSAGYGLQSRSMNDLNNNSIFEGEEMPVSPSSMHSLRNIQYQDHNHNNSDECENADECCVYPNSLIAPSVMSEVASENVTKILNDINESLQKENLS